MDTKFYTISPIDGHILSGDYVDEHETSISYDNIDAVLSVTRDQLNAGVNIQITIDTFYEEQEITF